MVSLDALLALVGSPEDSPQGHPEETAQAKRRRRRHDWVRGDVRCLMCGRLLGRLLGSDDHRQSTDRSTWHSASFFAYRPADETLHVMPFRPGMRFRCSECGGTGVLDEVEYFSTYDEVPVTAQNQEPVRRGPGRPPRPMPAIHSAPDGLTVALTTLSDSSALCRRTAAS